MTAEEFLEKQQCIRNVEDFYNDVQPIDLIEFAKLKCKEMQEAILNNVEANFTCVGENCSSLKEGIDYEVSVNRASVIEAYDINNIK